MIYSNFLFISAHGDSFAFPNLFLVLLLHQCPSVACPGRSEVFPCKVRSSWKLDCVTHSFWHVLFYKKAMSISTLDQGWSVQKAEHVASPQLGKCHLLLNSSVTAVPAREQPAPLYSPKWAFLALQHLWLISTTEWPLRRH